MGCDIHPICEVKENGIWKINSEKIFPNHYYSEERKAKAAEEGREYHEKEFNELPSRGRSYDWFAILADVRNGRGFAGIKTGEPFAVIADPRGLPDDLSVDGLKYFCLPIAPTKELEDEEDEAGNYFVSRTSAESWAARHEKIISIGGTDWVTNPDYHSQSYLYLEDFDKFDWNQLTMKYGVISLDEYKEFRGTTNYPESWSGSISGPNIIVVDTETADQILDKKIKELTKKSLWGGIEETKPVEDWNVFVDYEWPVLYSEWFSSHIQQVVEPMRKLKEKYEDVRFVFAFDN